MPSTEVLFYQDENGRGPVVEWLQELRREDRKAYAKCVTRIRRLAEAGHELHRPEADYLRDDIHELRARRRKEAFERNPERHTYEEDANNG